MVVVNIFSFDEEMASGIPLIHICQQLAK